MVRRRRHVCQRNRDVRLRQSGQLVEIEPRVDALHCFYTGRHIPVPLSNGNVAVVPVNEPMVWRQDTEISPQQFCYAGLAPLVAECLEHFGRTVTHCGDTLKPLGGSVPSGDIVDAGMIEFIRQNERGLILYDPEGRVSVARLIAQIALAFPRLRMVVVATRARRVRQLRRQIAEYGLDVGLATSRDGRPRHTNIVVSTPMMLATADVAIMHREIFIAVDPQELFGGFLKPGVEGVQQLWRGRLYGLLSVDSRPEPWLRDCMTSVFGMHRCIVPRHGYESLPVQVAFERIAGGPRPADHRQPFVVKHDGIHEHAVRNRRICRLGRALTENDQSVLAAQFPTVASCINSRGAGRVGILVDHIGHGLRLARMLQWPIVTGPEFVADGLAADELDALRLGADSRVRTRRPAIVTGDGMRRAGRFDTLIRADGGVGRPAIPPTKLAHRRSATGSLLLIDFRDETHPLLRKWSRGRRQAYRSAGWEIVGEVLPTPLDRFMDLRPRVYSYE